MIHNPSLLLMLVHLQKFKFIYPGFVQVLEVLEST